MILIISISANNVVWIEVLVNVLMILILITLKMILIMIYQVQYLNQCFANIKRGFAELVPSQWKKSQQMNHGVLLSVSYNGIN